jgi:hypothetical protein
MGEAARREAGENTKVGDPLASLLPVHSFLGIAASRPELCDQEETMPRLASTIPLALLLAAVALPGRARADLYCKEPVVHRDEVRSGTILSQRFVFHNRGPGEAEVTDLHPSCGCLKPVLEKRRYQPGNEGSLLVEINTLTQPRGPQSWRVRVQYTQQGQPQELNLLVSANIETDLRLEPAALVLYTEKAASHELTLTDTRSEPLGIAGISTTSLHLRTRVEGPQRTETGHSTWSIHLDVQDSCPPGRHEEMVQIITHDPAYRELKFPVTIVKRVRQVVRAAPDAAAFDGPVGQPLASRIVLLSSAGDEEVQIDRIDCGHPALRCGWAKGPGNRATLKISVDVSMLQAGTTQSQVEIHLLRPTRETLTIPVTCTLR